MQEFKIVATIRTEIPTSLADIEFDVAHLFRNFPQVQGLQIVEVKEPVRTRLGRKVRNASAVVGEEVREAAAVVKNSAAVTVEAIKPEPKFGRMTVEEAGEFIRANSVPTA